MIGRGGKGRGHGQYHSACEASGRGKGDGTYGSGSGGDGGDHCFCCVGGQERCGKVVGDRLKAGGYMRGWGSFCLEMGFGEGGGDDLGRCGGGSWLLVLG